jgi:hypothetical protein
MRIFSIKNIPDEEFTKTNLPKNSYLKVIKSEFIIGVFSKTTNKPIGWVKK